MIVQLYGMATIEISRSAIIDMESDASSGDSAAGTTTTASSASSPPAIKEFDSVLGPRPRIDLDLAELFSENVAAKIWRVAVSHLEQEVCLRYKSSK